MIIPFFFKCISFLLFLLVSCVVLAQVPIPLLKTSSSSKHKIGFVIGYGCQNSTQLLSDIRGISEYQFRQELIDKGLTNQQFGMNVDYSYRVLFFQLQYYYSIVRNDILDIDFLLQPQFNRTRLRKTSDSPTENDGFEYGLNIGLFFKKQLYKDILSLYILLSLGPHYVSITPERQTNGFIFSDNIFMGMHIKIRPKLFFDLRTGFRHISNAELALPNKGVNTFVLSTGIAYQL